MVAVSVFHMRGGRVVDKRELFWEDQENFDPGEFFGSVLKQYYLDAPFIPVEIHVPADFEDRALLEDWLSGAARPQGGDPDARSAAASAR